MINLLSCANKALVRAQTTQISLLDKNYASLNKESVFDQFMSMLCNALLC